MRGVFFGGASHHLLFQNNFVHDVECGTTSMNVSEVTIRGNQCDYLRHDCFKMSGVKNVLFEWNTGATHIYAKPTIGGKGGTGDHVDFMQAQGPVVNGVFRFNIAIMGTRSFQGLFFDGDNPNVKDDYSDRHPHTNIEVSNNLIYNAHPRAISFRDGSVNIRAFKNTVMTAPDKEGAAWIYGATVSKHNVIGSRAGTAGWHGSNLYLQYENAKANFYYGDAYDTVTRPGDLRLKDFRPLSSGPAGCGSSVGAEQLLCQLLK
jgi:hypothetical protein